MAQEMDSGSRAQAPRGTRLPKRKRRGQLMAAARDVFVSVGYHAAAMDDIAARAGVTKPVLYQHFASKRDLYLAILDEGSRLFLSQIRGALRSTEDNEQRVYETIRAYFQFVAHDDADYRLLFESDLANLPEVARRTHRVADQGARMVAEVIAEDTGLTAEQALLLASGLLGMAQVSAQTWLRGGRQIPADEAASLVAELAWQGISDFPLTRPSGTGDADRGGPGPAGTQSGGTQSGGTEPGTPDAALAPASAKKSRGHSPAAKPTRRSDSGPTST